MMDELLIHEIKRGNKNWTKKSHGGKPDWEIQQTFHSKTVKYFNLSSSQAHLYVTEKCAEG